MNTLSKYDIADIVSNISGNTQAVDMQPSEGKSFADLLREAVKNIPQSNAEGKAAESGKTQPELPHRDQSVKSQIAAEGLAEPELHDLLRQAFSQTHSESTVKVSVNDKNDAEHRSVARLQENSDLINNLRAALKFQGEIRAEEIGKNNTDSLIHPARLTGEDSNVIDDQIRVATLKQRRPVILGPGSHNDELRSQILANYFENDSFLRNELADSSSSLGSEVTFNQNLFHPPSENSLDTTKQTDKLDRFTETKAQQKIILDKSIEVPDDDLDVPLKNQILKQDDYEKASFVNDESKVGFGNAENIGAEDLVLSKERGNPEIARSFQELRQQIKQSDKTIQHQEVSNFVPKDETSRGDSTQFIGRNINPSEKFQEESNSERMFFRHSTNESELKSQNKDSMDQKPPVDQVLALRETGLSSGDRQRVTELRSTDFNPQEFDPSADAYLKASNEFRSNLAQHNSESKDREVAADVEVPSRLVAGMKKEELEAQFGKVSVKEKVDVLKNSSRESVQNVEFEIRVNEAAKRHVDQNKLSVLDSSLTVEKSDPNINTQRAESVEVLKSEAFVNLHSDKSAVSSRSELAQRSVSVSNFSSEMQETIMGQLTKTASGTSKFTVSLFPENLGKISIEISYSDLAGLKISMIGDNPEATKILEQNLPTLRENLQTDKLNELLVNLNNRDSNGSNQKHNQSEGGNFASKEDKEVGHFDFTDSNSETRSAATNDLETGLDTYV